MSKLFDAAAAAETLCGFLSFDDDGVDRRVNLLNLAAFTTSDRARDAIPRAWLNAVFAMLSPTQRHQLMFDLCHLGDDKLHWPTTPYSTPDPTRGFSAEERTMWFGKLARRGLSGEQFALLGLANARSDLGLITKVVALACKFEEKFGFLTLLAATPGSKPIQNAEMTYFSRTGEARCVAFVLDSMSLHEHAIALERMGLDASSYRIVHQNKNRFRATAPLRAR